MGFYKNVYLSVRKKFSWIRVEDITNRAGLTDAAEYGFDTLSKWLSGDSSQPLGGWTPVGYLDALFSSNKPQK